MYSLSQIKKGILNPETGVREIKSRFGRSMNSLRGIKYLEKDWDNLILLDACRYDLFKEENIINGELSAVKSNASTSAEYFEKNISDQEHGDLVYYSANPHIDNITASFFDLYRLWETDWDEETGTVLPSSAVDRVLATANEYDDKRLIIHLMQPHRPFLGELARDFDQSGFARQGVNVDYGEGPDTPFWWDRMEDGILTKEEVWPMYRETLQVTLPHVQRLVANLAGKSVISADHGNVFGESGLYGHPGNTHHDKLVTVPWLEIDKTRKEIVSENATIQSHRRHYSQAEDQLEALGYIE